jgi:hypothetical protein
MAVRSGRFGLSDRRGPRSHGTFGRSRNQAHRLPFDRVLRNGGRRETDRRSREPVLVGAGDGRWISGSCDPCTRARCKRVCRKEASVMSEQRTDEAEQYVILDDEPRATEAGEEEAQDDEGAALEDLIEEMVVPEEATREAKEAIPPSFLPRRMTGQEFTCSSCHLIMARSCLADEERLLCHDCVIEAGSEDVPAPHLYVIERPCPVCGRVLLVPERPDSVCGYYCPGCGVHVRTRRWASASGVEPSRPPRGCSPRGRSAEPGRSRRGSKVIADSYRSTCRAFGADVRANGGRTARGQSGRDR